MNEIPQLLAHWHRNGLDSVAEAFLQKQRRSQSYAVSSAHQCRPFVIGSHSFQLKLHSISDDTLKAPRGDPEDLITY